MGLFGKSFTSKLKSITSLAVSRIGILKNHCKARASYARSDVAQLLNLGYHDQALLRVEHWIVEQNMLDAFVMIEDYCNVLRERVQVLENNKECPFELKEATCSLIFASSRCGEFPELHKIQEILTSKFGREFADNAVKLYKNNRVNTKMIQMLSSRHPTMEIKMKALKQIAKEIGVTLHFEKDPTLTNMDKLNVAHHQRQDEMETKECSSDDAEHKENNQHDFNQSVIKEDKCLLDVNEEKRRNKYAAAAALEALELAYFEISKYSNHSSKQKDVVISKRNFSIDLKEELEGKQIQKQYEWEEESQLSQNPRDVMTTKPNNSTSLASKENTKGESNMVDELSLANSLDDDNDHKTSSDFVDVPSVSKIPTLDRKVNVEYDIRESSDTLGYAHDRSNVARENEHLSEEIAYPSSQAIRWNPQRSQTNPVVRRRTMQIASRTNFANHIHTDRVHVDWKMMSMRTKRAHI
ncbi:uncharacterized protein [Cicer arietinum]|uniref:Uncharacterized protein LOC101501121 n=1 Tax=Cicer arietinum TaxID=3827 RepID=A0A1S2XIL2_CICAR|nr:uncharacterized protein LOC101501121 [Cicer arietinum]